MKPNPRILIVTAAFGEGHNSAARNLSLALQQAGATTHVADPCTLGSPFFVPFISKIYRDIITHLPSLWAWIYQLTDRYDLIRPKSLNLRPTLRSLQAEITTFKPDAIVSTYPLYPYLIPLTSLAQTSTPLFTVITDSIEINASWLRTHSDHWFVTDSYTEAILANRSIAPSSIHATGFPVHPIFTQLKPLQAEDSCSPFRVLYFPTPRPTAMFEHATALLETAPHVTLTLVLGRNVRKLYPTAKKLKLAYPDRVRLIGWTKQVPRWLSEHHLVVGKAGGATVHEAIAAQCPMFIHQLVPGQEEGNLKLLEKLSCGTLADTASALQSNLSQLLANNASEWRRMKQTLASYHKNNGALRAADLILKTLSSL
jgi:processive 1,2-diacylglycerol beta-glucosyltransferase